LQDAPERISISECTEEEQRQRQLQTQDDGDDDASDAERVLFTLAAADECCPAADTPLPDDTELAVAAPDACEASLPPSGRPRTPHTAPASEGKSRRFSACHWGTIPCRSS